MPPVASENDFPGTRGSGRWSQTSNDLRAMNLSPLDPLWPVVRADALADARQGRLSRLDVLREAGLDEDANRPLLDALRAGGQPDLSLHMPARPGHIAVFAMAAAASIVELVLHDELLGGHEASGQCVIGALLAAGARLPRLRELEIQLAPVGAPVAAEFLRAHRDTLCCVRLISWASAKDARDQARAVGPALRALHSLEELYLSARLWDAAANDPLGNPLLPLPSGLRRMNGVRGSVGADALPPRLEALSLQPPAGAYDEEEDQPAAEVERLLARAPPTLRAMSCVTDALNVLGPGHSARLTSARIAVGNEGATAAVRRLVRGDFPALRNLAAMACDATLGPAEHAALAQLIAGRAWDGLVLTTSLPVGPPSLRSASAHSGGSPGTDASWVPSDGAIPERPPPLGAHIPSPLALAAVSCPRVLNLMLLVPSDVGAEVASALLSAHPELQRLDLCVLRGSAAPSILVTALEIHPGLREVRITAHGPSADGEVMLLEACFANNAARRRRQRERAAWAVVLAGVRRIPSVTVPARAAIPWHHHSIGGRVADFLGPNTPAPRLVCEATWSGWRGWRIGGSVGARRWWDADM
jgi:hypothetical protein